MKSKKPIIKGYVKEYDSQLLVNIQTNVESKVNKRAVAKVNALLSDNDFKKDVRTIRAKSNILSEQNESLLTKEVYFLISKYGFTRDWFNTFLHIVTDNTFNGIIEGETIHVKNIGATPRYELNDFKAVNPIAIFIKPDTSLEELQDFLSKNWAKVTELQRKYNSTKLKPSIKSVLMLDIERTILEHITETPLEISRILSKKYAKKGNPKAYDKYGINYVDKVLSRLRKNILNQ